jgi:carboxypeptidase PM20D1
MTWLAKIAKYLGGLLLLLIAILLVNTLRLPSLPDASSEKFPPFKDLDAAVKRLSAALQIPTISYGFANPPGGNRFPDLHKLIEDSYPLVHKSLKREIVADSSLLYTWEGSEKSLPPILLAAHQDVVPIEPGTEGKWTHPPFSGRVADGFVWGRGAVDNKSMLMANLEAVERLLADGYQPKRTILMAFGHDEEVGGPLGAQAITNLLSERKVRALFSVDEGQGILEGVVPGVSRPVAQIGLSEKGFMTLQLKAVAPGGHSSMPPPQTAVGKLGQAIAKLESNQVPASLDGPGGDALRSMAPALPFLTRVVIANTWLFGPVLIKQLSGAPSTNALIRTTTAPTIVKGGIKENVLPTEAFATVNFRIAPGDSIASVKAHVEKVIADPDVTISDGGAFPPKEPTPTADMNNPGFALISQAIRGVEPGALITPGLVLAGTDSKHYTRVSDATFHFCPVRLSPDDLKRIHATDERIGISNYGEIISFYIHLIRDSTK